MGADVRGNVSKAVQAASLRRKGSRRSSVELARIGVELAGRYSGDP